MDTGFIGQHFKVVNKKAPLNARRKTNQSLLLLIKTGLKQNNYTYYMENKNSESIKEGNKEKFKRLESFRKETIEKITPESQKIIEKSVKKAWEEYGETFRALS